MSSKLVMKKAIEKLEAGQELAIATVTEAKGSTPREAGAKMLVLDSGEAFGTVGGGAMERMIIEKCQEAIKKGENEHVSFRLADEGVEMTCGGSMDVFIEVFINKPKLIIVGGGHVGYAIYQAAQNLEFDIVIVEDRKEFASRERFPHAKELVLGDIEESLKEYPIDEDSYIVIVTRGHKYDQKALEAVLDSKASYIGAMGSKAKVIKMFRNLEEEGIDREELDKVYSPIGLDISCGTPEEIAISILAEVLLVKNQGSLVHMRESLPR